MSDLKFNSIAGAVLASVLGVMTIGAVSDGLFEPHFPEKVGFMPEVDLSAVSGGGPAAPEGPPDFGRLMADPAALADLVARGERGIGVCRSCHTFEAGGANGIGPNLHDVFGRQVASHGGYQYSEAMAAHGGAWSYDTLDAYLRSPAQNVRGTKMAFVGIRNTDDRVAVISYLRSITPNPPPLPAPLPEAAPAEAPAAPVEEAAPAAEAPAPG